MVNSAFPCLFMVVSRVMDRVPVMDVPDARAALPGLELAYEIPELR